MLANNKVIRSKALLLFILILLIGGVVIQHPRSKVVSPQPRTRALVVPHHELIVDQFASYYGNLSKADSEQTTHVILLAPSHFQPENQVVKTRKSDFELPLGKVVRISTEVVSPLLKSGEVKEDDAVFMNEHAVFLHLPYLLQYFPHASVTPLLFTRNVPENTLDAVVGLLRAEMRNTHTLLLFSGDFSHYLSFSQAEKNDAVTLQDIMQDKPESIRTLSDDYLDCSACAYVLLKVLEDGGYHKPQLLFHGNSLEFARNVPDGLTTSYFVLKWE